MYVIKRTDKSYGNFTVSHKTLDEAIEEAQRLANVHVRENPTFIIYELVEAGIISSKVKVALTISKL